LAQAGTVIFTRRGKPVAALRNLSGSDWESVSLANNPQFQALIDESRRSYHAQGGLSLDKVRAELGLKKNLSKRRTARSKGKRG